nr:GtrA family protein [Planosporangium mesophilum]
MVDRVLAVVPQPFRSILIKRRESVKFLMVGGFCYVLAVLINYGLKFTVLPHRPVTALTIATVITAIISYFLNREWSFRTRGGRRRHHEATLFFLISAVAVGLTDIPLLMSRYVFDLKVPTVSRPVQELSDFVFGMILGTLLGMVFRLWAFRRWVFPHENVRPDRVGRASAPGNGDTRVTGHPVPADSAVSARPGGARDSDTASS